jgi:predicted GH43/DUF377 family glycosyl hydrolase
VTDTDLANRLDLTLAPDPRRVIAKLFVPGEDASMVSIRAAALVERIRRLDDEEIRRLLQQTLRIFGSRHHDLEAIFARHYELIRHRVPSDGELSPMARLLVGAHFTHEYAVEAAALCNPSMVVHPDQSGLKPGQLRAAISLRQIGEGHISSIGFATAILEPPADTMGGARVVQSPLKGALTVADRSGPVTPGLRGTARHHRDLLAARPADAGHDNGLRATVLASLPEWFDDEDFERALARIPAELIADGAAREAIEQLRDTIAASYAVSFPAEVGLDQRVLWPATPSECNGMEDARFVEFIGDDGAATYLATYTAYDGRHISTRLLRSDDLLHFDIAPLRGPAMRSKGMALFPRTVHGRHLALSRSDGETIGLTERDENHQWQTPVPLHPPSLSWGLVQVGNCGSPLETSAGWLVLTHGVGPMRRYAIGAMLLDLHRPEHVIAILPGTLLAPDENDRDGYVPNVVYSCGALLHHGTLWVPYGASDTRVGFAHIALDTLISALRAT